uniref:Uncharacterized protein n=1 Tax=Cyanothece sp. (strain PCC 7425 / ATCC 29141) TaxID=395961 RepID=B8HZ10_CYAP4
MTVEDIPIAIQNRFPNFCRLVRENQNRPRLPEGYQIDVIYTCLDDVPCDTYKQDYRFSTNLPPEAKFTTAMIYFNQEVVWAWCAGKIHVNRIPENFDVNFETELGNNYQYASQAEDAQKLEVDWCPFKTEELEDAVIETQDSSSKVANTLLTDEEIYQIIGKVIHNTYFSKKLKPDFNQLPPLPKNILERIYQKINEAIADKALSDF